jgi:dephospho-CoA kinase
LIDADSIAHTVYQPGSRAVADIVREFGPDMLKADESGEIDRQRLGAIVFSDREAMKKLEGIVWPHVQQKIQKQIHQLESDWHSRMEANSGNKKLPVVVVEAAVLLDAEWHDKFMDAVWVITAPHEVAIKRLIENRSLTREEADKRIHAQASRRGIGNIEEEIKNKIVTAAIDNSGSPNELKEALSLRLTDVTAWYGASAVGRGLL